MKPILYEKNEAEFTSNGIGRLSDAISCVVTEARNGVYELTAEYPADGIHAKEIIQSRIIFAVPAEGKDPQAFRIKEITKPINGTFSIYAEHISYQLSFIPVSPFEASTCRGALQGLKANAAETCPFDFWTDKETANTFRLKEPASIRSVLGGTQGSILDIFGSAEYEFDMYTVKLYQNRGSDRGVTFRYGKNIVDLEQEESLENVYTGVYPFWSGETEEEGEIIVTLPEKVLHAATAANYPFQRTVPLDLSGSFESQPTVAQLRTAAQRYIENNNIGYPKVSLKVDVAALWQAEEYKDLAIFEQVNLCDTVTVIFPKFNIEVQAKVTQLEWDVLRERYISIYIGDSRTDLADTINMDQKAATEALNSFSSKVEADIGRFKNITTEQLSAVSADIETLRTVDLYAVNADIHDLSVDYANIRSLLAGNAGVGDLQTISLTSSNTTIDTALIRNAVMQTVTVGDLLAGRISTDKFTVGDDDGGMIFSGATTIYKDSEGNVRCQIGEDATGNFTFLLYNADGTGLMLDADTGLQPSAIGDGLINNRMVADNANISAFKLDITSFFDVINNAGNEYTIYGSKVWMDEQGQSLTQLYSRMSESVTQVSNNVTTIGQAAEAAETTAQAASRTAESALQALSGISTLDALGVSLSNDAHVVHTDFDGTGGVYTDCNTKVFVYMGESNVTDYSTIYVTPSAGLAGTWNNSTKVYQVTGMTGDNGYVDFDIAHGAKPRDFETPDEKLLVLPDGKILSMDSLAAHVHKRFSVSKSPDGRAGISYAVHSDADIILRQTDGTLVPTSITFTATQSQNGSVTSYIGRYIIETSADGAAFTEVYRSASPEINKVFVIPSGVRVVRCTLTDAVLSMLSRKSIIVMADADQLAEEMGEAKRSIQTLTTSVSNIETSFAGLRVDLSDITTELHGVSDGTLLYQAHYERENGVMKFEAKVYKSGQNVARSFRPEFFRWYKKTKDGMESLGTGYTKNVNESLFDADIGGSVVGIFNTFDDCDFVTPDEKVIVFPDGKELSIYVNAE